MRAAPLLGVLHAVAVLTACDDPIAGGWVQVFNCSTTPVGGAELCTESEETDEFNIVIDTSRDERAYIIRGTDGFEAPGTLDGQRLDWVGTPADGAYTETGQYSFNADFTTFTGTSTFRAEDRSFSGSCTSAGAQRGETPATPAPVGSCPTP